MQKKISIVMSVAAVVFGVVFAVSGIKTIAEKDLYDTQITATVVDVQEEWESAADPDEPDRLVNTAYIDYEIDGTKYEHVLAPEQDDSLKVGVIFIILGALVAIAGCVSAVRVFIKKR